MEHWKILHSAKDLKQKRRNVKRSADVSGNARHFCDCELNFTGYEGSQDVSIIYQLLFINKKNTIYLIRYIVFSLFYGALQKIPVMD